MPSPITIAAAVIALICEPSVKSVCLAGRCEATPAATWATVDQAKNSYSRCDRNGCDDYTARFSQSGAYQTIEVPGRGLLARIGPNREFVEIATLGTDVYVSYGQCRENR